MQGQEGVLGGGEMVSSQYACVCQRVGRDAQYKSTPIQTIHRVTYLCQMMVITILEKARPVSDSVAEVDTCVVCGVQCEPSNMSTKHGGRK